MIPGPRSPAGGRAQSFSAEEAMRSVIDAASGELVEPLLPDLGSVRSALGAMCRVLTPFRSRTSIAGASRRACHTRERNVR